MIRTHRTGWILLTTTVLLGSLLATPALAAPPRPGDRPIITPAVTPVHMPAATPLRTPVRTPIATTRDPATGKERFSIELRWLARPDEVAP